MIPGELLADRYEIVRELGKNPAGATYLARDRRTGRSVAARLLHVGLVTDWKTIELFEREAAVLRSLHHARIPAYVDSFRADLEGDPRFVLVRDYIDGTDLQEMVDHGWRGTEEQIRGIGRQLVEVVSYIHSLRPPVIHRDITPRNIVARPGGEISLVDFGGVQDAIRLSAAATTMIGTPGYAPMEQFLGRASVRSDLYGLAATLVFLLTRRSPADLPTKALKVDIAAVIDISSAGLARVLSNWLEPDEAARTLPVETAAELLSAGPEAAVRPAEAAPTALPRRPPTGSRIVFTESGSGATYRLPMGARAGGRRMGSFGMIWLVFVGFWTYSALRMRAPTGFLLFAIPFLAVGLGVLRRALTSLFGHFELRIDGGGVSYSNRFLFASRRRSVPLDEVGDCRLDGGVLLDVGARTLRLGDGLSNREREWLRDSVNGLLRRLRGGSRLDSSRGSSQS
jgi:serine/threonine protein kinase